MSPEQFRGESNLGPPSDVYAFGVLAYELLAGRPPFDGQSFADLAIAHTSASPPPMDMYGIGKQLSDLVLRCLDKDPAKRPRAESIAQSLRGLAAGAPSSQIVTTMVDPFSKTAGMSAALSETILATAHTEVSKRDREKLLTVLLAVAVFVVTSAAGLAIYFFLF
jgi:serine/threonine protein kinase